MPRIHSSRLVARESVLFELLVPRPTSVPAGYTPVVLVTEWLTLNCQGDWCCRANSKGLVVRFAREADHARASARFLTPDVVVTLANGAPPGAGGRKTVRRVVAA